MTRRKLDAFIALGISLLLIYAMSRMPVHPLLRLLVVLAVVVIGGVAAYRLWSEP